MEIILWLVLGLVAGILAMFLVYRTIPNTSLEWVGAVVIGLIGGWLGGLIANALGLQSVNWIGSLVIAFVGAWIILFGLQRLMPRART